MPDAYLSSEVAKQRLDRFLQQQAPEQSRSVLARWIEEGRVSVNGKAVHKAGYSLRSGDQVSWQVPDLQPLLHVMPEAIPLKIVYEDAHLLVINKPVGMVVHPGAGHSQGTLVNALLAHCQDLSGIGGVERPGIVHRLDKDTSGLLVVAKTDAAHQSLSAQLQSREMKRSYYALSEHGFTEEQGCIEAPIGRHPTARQMMAVVPQGRFARTHWQVSERFEGYTLLAVQLDTGRTHQIRVHLKSIQRPLVGDPLYGSGRKHRFKVTRPLLHAWRLAFFHPQTQQALAFEASLPEDFEQVLEILKQQKTG